MTLEQAMRDQITRIFGEDCARAVFAAYPTHRTGERETSLDVNPTTSEQRKRAEGEYHDVYR